MTRPGARGRDPSVRAVLFDVGGTLWPDVWPAYADETRISQLRAIARFASADQASRLYRELRLFERALERERSQDTRGRIVAIGKELGLPLTPLEADGIRHAMARPAADAVTLFEGATELFATLARLGLPAALVSNAVWRTGPEYLEDFRALGVDSGITFALSSVDTGVRKPDPEIFADAARRLGVAGEDCIVVGNLEENDVLPGRAIGARTIRVAVEAKLLEASAADAVATSLRAVLELITTWAHPRPTLT